MSKIIKIHTVFKWSPDNFGGLIFLGKFLKTITCTSDLFSQIRKIINGKGVLRLVYEFIGKKMRL